jgi:hypothetical protein
MIWCSVIDTRLMAYVIVEFLSQLPIIDKKGYIEYGILLSVLLFTASDNSFGIFWPLCCLSFYLRLLITHLVSFGHCVVCPSNDLMFCNRYKVNGLCYCWISITTSNNWQERVYRIRHSTQFQRVNNFYLTPNEHIFSCIMMGTDDKLFDG